jgi:histidine triad (HIT) family protein
VNTDPTCIFCRIAAREIIAALVYEDERTLAFLDIGPLNPGHTLIVPKAHFATLPEMPDEDSAACALVLPRLCRAVRHATNAEGLNVIVNVGRVAGQTVDHVHWHIIPRFSHDALRWPWPAGRYERDTLEQLRGAIEKAISAS